MQKIIFFKNLNDLIGKQGTSVFSAFTGNAITVLRAGSILDRLRLTTSLTRSPEE
jgi:hypothetical protein